MSEKCPVVPNANHVILEKPRFPDYQEDGGLVSARKSEPKVQSCRVLAVGEVLDRKEAPHDISVGDLVLVDAESIDTVTLLVKERKMYVVPNKCILARIDED